MNRVGLVFLLGMQCLAGDWPDWRGPNRDSRSDERNLPVKWSPAGENLLWRVPHGGRSAPIVIGDRVYLLNTTGQGATLQERVMCLDALTGKTLWEHRYNVYMSDVPPHRAAWSAPAGDLETGNVYTFGVGGTLLALSRDGKLLWERSLAEELGLVTTHGGRTVSPVVEGDLVVVSGITSGWGDQARAAHRFYAFDKHKGDLVWVSSPGGRPYDTTYSPPVVANIEGVRMFIAGASDGAVHAVKMATGEPVWKFVMSKRGLNTGVAINGTTAIVTHSEENIGTNEMGMIAALDAKARGEIGKEQVKWSKIGYQAGFSSPITAGDHIYQLDNSANLFGFDVVSGKTLWQLKLGTLQKATPVLADGKLYVGTENGKFFIVRVGHEKAEILDEDWLGSEQKPEIIYASPAISNGRVFVVSADATYCFGSKEPGPKFQPVKPQVARSTAEPAWVQVVPAEVALKPGDKVKFTARLFDPNGQFVREETAAWIAKDLRGNLANDGTFTAPSDAAGQAGTIQATAGKLNGAARVRIVVPLPWTQDFEALPAKSVPPHWINVQGKSEVRELDGGKVLAKLADNPFTKRARAYMGPNDASNYTVEVDVRAIEKRRQLGDAGVVAQRYSLILFGNHQRIELQSWQPETARTVVKPFPWKGDVWYRLKLRVEPAANGKVKVMGKAWPKTEPEPSEWTIEREDPTPNLVGSPGLYADAANEIYFDNLKVTPN
jgi:outer membrane protein assembly factor BamB